MVLLEKGKFKCWSCKEVYEKRVDDRWLRWKCPICKVETSGTGSEIDEETDAVLTLPPLRT